VNLLDVYRSEKCYFACIKPMDIGLCYGASIAFYYLARGKFKRIIALDF
jgi:dienelactone hydrolase